MDKIELCNITKAYAKNPPVIENLNLKISEGSFTVLLGPSGCGKSTILRMIAGLEKETAGELLIDGKNVSGVEPGDRHVAMVFQNYALYPTMNVKENIEFGLKNLKIPKAEREKRIQEIAKMVGLGEYLSRKPQQLSGGQRQRVALARAIVKKPAVFLMDEPLSNLDAKLRNQIRTDLIELYRKLNATFVYVTHDQVEAMSMGTDIVLLEKGEIRQIGSPPEIYGKPENVFTARFIGSPSMNILSAEELKKADLPVPPKAKYVGFRPEKASIGGREKTPRENEVALQGTILAREMLGDQILYKVQSPFGVFHVKSFELQMLEYGTNSVLIKNSDLFYFDEEENRMVC
ncbi:ABC transporter ATP-binding protein [Caproicibacter sp.]|uniref:ABC transporter ATP-binding protein n=1 Tax=Caproicibacter sp. TaxID=2814884 RepID=UPI00398A1E1A